MPTPHTAAFIDALRAVFAAHADASRAGEMQAHMKSALPFHGIPAPLRRKLSADVVRPHPAPDAQALAATMQALWRTVRYREERYAAMELARVGSHARLQTGLGLRASAGRCANARMLRLTRWRRSAASTRRNSRR